MRINTKKTPQGVLPDRQALLLVWLQFPQRQCLPFWRKVSPDSAQILGKDWVFVFLVYFFVVFWFFCVLTLRRNFQYFCFVSFVFVLVKSKEQDYFSAVKICKRRKLVYVLFLTCRIVVLFLEELSFGTSTWTKSSPAEAFRIWLSGYDALVQFLLLQSVLCLTPVPSVAVTECCRLMQKAGGVCHLKMVFHELL